MQRHRDSCSGAKVVKCTDLRALLHMHQTLHWKCKIEQNPVITSVCVHFQIPIDFSWVKSYGLLLKNYYYKILKRVIFLLWQKITTKNAFGLHLIDYMADILKQKDSELTNFKVWRFLNHFHCIKNVEFWNTRQVLTIKQIYFGFLLNWNFYV